MCILYIVSIVYRGASMNYIYLANEDRNRMVGRSTTCCTYMYTLDQNTICKQGTILEIVYNDRPLKWYIHIHTYVRTYVRTYVLGLPPVTHLRDCPAFREFSRIPQILNAWRDLSRNSVKHQVQYNSHVTLIHIPHSDEKRNNKILIRGHGGIHRIRNNYYAIMLLYFNVTITF